MLKVCTGCSLAGASSSDKSEQAITLACPASTWSDQLLVQACLRGDERAWALLLDRYQRLIQSYPRRYGASASDAADVFQSVCVELVMALPRLRNQESVRSWITTVAAHQAYQWKRRHVTRSMREHDDPDVGSADASIGPLHAVEQADEERLVREALWQLAPRCQRLLRLLFYQDPPVPYHTVAARLGMTAGSVRFVRARCLKRLKRALDGAGSVPARSQRTLPMN